MEPTKSEWYYAELLDFLKQKEKQKEEAYYQPLELPLYEQPQLVPIGDELLKEEEKDRGIVIIDLALEDL